MDKMIAVCGLDCGSCDARKATVENDDALRAKVARLWSEMNGVEITPQSINCEGCRADGVKTPYCAQLCPIRQCALGKKRETCGQCEALDECKTVAMITSNNAKALKNLKSK